MFWCSWFENPEFPKNAEEALCIAKCVSINVETLPAEST